MNDLYPLKFTSIFKQKIWGGNRLRDTLLKNTKGLTKVGESWELSGVPGDYSVVSHGAFKGKNISEIIFEHKAALLGSKVFERFGPQFPLLFKFIDANDYLSLQVHPNDELAAKRHNSFGKTEMWYVVDAEKDAELIVGFNQPLSKDEYLKSLLDNTLRESLNFEKVIPGDVFHLPAGRIHAAGPGVLFAEIQQTSDITYRIYDWNRLDEKGQARELHTDLAGETIDFSYVDAYKTAYENPMNGSVQLVSCPYYTTRLLNFNKKITRNYSSLDSFVVYMAIAGDTSIQFSEFENPVLLKKGETVLIPACLKYITLQPKDVFSKVLEVFV